MQWQTFSYERELRSRIDDLEIRMLEQMLGAHASVHFVGELLLTWLELTRAKALADGDAALAEGCKVLGVKIQSLAKKAWDKLHGE